MSATAGTRTCKGCGGKFLPEEFRTSCCRCHACGEALIIERRNARRNRLAL